MNLQYFPVLDRNQQPSSTGAVVRASGAEPPFRAPSKLYGAFPGGTSADGILSHQPIVLTDRRGADQDNFFDKDEPIRSRNPV